MEARKSGEAPTSCLPLSASEDSMRQILLAAQACLVLNAGGWRWFSKAPEVHRVQGARGRRVEEAGERRLQEHESFGAWGADQPIRRLTPPRAFHGSTSRFVKAAIMSSIFLLVPFVLAAD